MSLALLARALFARDGGDIGGVAIVILANLMNAAHLNLTKLDHASETILRDM